MKKFVADRPFADPDVAARKLVEIANGVEAVQDGEDFRAGIERAIALGWSWRHESGTYVTFTDCAAALFAWYAEATPLRRRALQEDFGELALEELCSTARRAEKVALRIASSAPTSM